MAGIHDTAINDCDNIERNTIGAGDDLSDAQRAAAQKSMTNNVLQELDGVSTVRVTIPWDVADPSVVDGSSFVNNKTYDKGTLYLVRKCLDAWLQSVFALTSNSYHDGYSMEPEIDLRGDPYFAHFDGSTGTDGFPHTTQVYMPKLSQYKEAVTAFRQAYMNCSDCEGGGRVKILGPWNEPDNPGGTDGLNGRASNYNLLFTTDNATHLAGTICPDNPVKSEDCGAWMAAELWLTDYDLIMGDASVGGMNCSSCMVPAGIFSGYGTREIQGDPNGMCATKCSYLDLYDRVIENAGRHPSRWAIHPYSDMKAWERNQVMTPDDTSKFASALASYGYGRSTFIWVNEVSVCGPDGTEATCANPGDPGRDKWGAMNYLVGTGDKGYQYSVPENGPQIGRIDYLCLIAGEKQCSSDWAIVDSGSTVLNRAGDRFATWANGG